MGKVQSISDLSARKTAIFLLGSTKSIFKRPPLASHTCSVSADFPTPPLPTMMTLWREDDAEPFLDDDIVDYERVTSLKLIEPGIKREMIFVRYAVIA